MVFGHFGDDVLRGGHSNDRLDGGAGSDNIDGGRGNDQIDGGEGVDRLRGGSGRDILVGGADADAFMFENGDVRTTRTQADVVRDFAQLDGDLINLQFLDAKTATEADDRFAFLGNKAFSGIAGQLRYDVVAGNTFVEGNTDGDKLADFYVRLDGLHTLVAADFVF